MVSNMVDQKFKAILFDMDGVLLDSEPLWRIAEYETFLPFGIHLKSEDFKNTTGLKTNEVVEYRIREFNLDAQLQLKLERSILDIVKDLIRSKSHKNEGVEEISEWLNAHRIPRIIATSSPEEVVETVLETLNLKTTFPQYISAAKFPHGKPHPEVYLKACDVLKIKPYEATIIEDSVNGMIAGKAAKIHTCVVPEIENYNNPKFALADEKFRDLKTWLEFIKNRC